MSSPEKQATEKADFDPPALLLRFAMNNNGGDAHGDLPPTGNAGGPHSNPGPRGSWRAGVALQFTLLFIHCIVGACAVYECVIYLQIFVQPALSDSPSWVRCIFWAAPMLAGPSIVVHIFCVGRYLRRA